MKISAIEIGTNSTKFIIAELHENNTFEVLEKESTVNRLSKSMYGKNTLSEEAIDNGIKIIGEYVEASKAKGAELVSIFSTSVLRDAENRADFISKVNGQYNIDVEVISGEREACLAYRSCSTLIENAATKLAVIDIGGGSTEISTGDKNNVLKKYSLDVGAVRMTEMFVKNDPVTMDEINNVYKYVNDKLQDIDGADFSDITLVGTGGTIKTIGTILKKEDYKNENVINGMTVDLSEIEDIYSFLLKLKISSKKSLIGLNPKRADVINSGVIILLAIMKKLGITNITISSRGVIEGFVEDYLLTEACRK